ncbi:Ig-like domain-containing protein, partial [Pseudomonas aeruginosa]
MGHHVDHGAVGDRRGRGVGPVAAAVAPATPTVDPSNGTTLSGTAEPGSSVTLTDGNGNPIGQVTADGSGNWSFTP